MNLAVITAAEFPLLHTVLICLLNVAKLLVFKQILFMPGVCLRLIYLRVMFLKNKSSLLQQWEQEKMHFAHPNKTEQLHSDDLAPLQFGLKTCQYVRKGTPSVPRWQHALLQPSLSPPAAVCRYPTATFCAEHSVIFAWTKYTTSPRKFFPSPYCVWLYVTATSTQWF